MWDYILKSAEGKSKWVTMETLSSDLAKITPAFKILLYVLIVGFVSGYCRIVLIGFHPVLQGILLGLVMGTMCGKTLAIGQQVPSSRLFLRLLALFIGIGALVVHYFAIGYAIPDENASFLMLSWFANDMREIPQIIPHLGVGTLLEPVNRNAWMFANGLDAIAFIAALLFTLPQACKARLPQKESKANWQVYRMLFLVFALYGSVFITQRDQREPNLRKLENWTDEVWSRHYLQLVRERIDGLLLDESAPERIALEEAIDNGKNMDREFPEGHYLTAIDQLSKKNYYLARDELGRAIFETEQMTRRTWLRDGTPIHRDLLLAQLYEMRAKMLLEKENGLAAERDLTVAIIIHKDFWPNEPDSLRDGFFKHQSGFLEAAGYSAHFGFGASHYGRYLARKLLGVNEAQDDLDEALSLDYPVSERGR